MALLKKLSWIPACVRMSGDGGGDFGTSSSATNRDNRDVNADTGLTDAAEREAGIDDGSSIDRSSSDGGRIGNVEIDSIFGTEYNRTTTFSTQTSTSYQSRSVSENILGTQTSSYGVSNIGSDNMSMQEHKSAFGFDSYEENRFDSTGQNTFSETTIGIGDTSFTYDTHYDTANREASFFTEQIADVFDYTTGVNNYLDAETIGTMSAVEDVLSLAMGINPITNINLVATGKALPAAIGAWGLYTQAKTVIGLSERIGGSSSSSSGLVDSVYDGVSDAFGDDGIFSGTKTTTPVNTASVPTESFSQPQLSVVNKYASLASIVGDSTRQDFSYEAMQIFTVDYGVEEQNKKQFTIGDINEYKINV